MQPVVPALGQEGETEADEQAAISPLGPYSSLRGLLGVVGLIACVMMDPAVKLFEAPRVAIAERSGVSRLLMLASFAWAAA